MDVLTLHAARATTMAAALRYVTALAQPRHIGQLANGPTACLRTIR